MNRLSCIFLCLFALSGHGQDKYNHVHFNRLTEVTGMEFVIASMEDRGKMLETLSQYMLFINTQTGESTRVDFPDDAAINKIEQVKIDSLGINVIVVSARTTDLDGKNGIDWNDPSQIIILSTDGKQKNPLTDNTFFTNMYTVNRLTGTIVITGYYDSNNNCKYDKTDQNAIQIYNLKTFGLVGLL